MIEIDYRPVLVYRTSYRKPTNGSIVYVAGGIAQYCHNAKDGTDHWYSGMEEPMWTREITWPVEEWMPLLESVEKPSEKDEEIARLKQELDRIT